MIINTPLKGLVLAGGKSTRMGRDKGLMQWHDKEQQYHMADLLQNFCSDVFISCRKKQVLHIDAGYKALTDNNEDVGPLAGILSAFNYDPHCAWLVVACDMPLLDKATLAQLIQDRNENLFATSFINPIDNLPEPLVTIWEPKAYDVLKSLLVTGGGPRKVLMHHQIATVYAVNTNALLNANTPDDAKQITKML